MSVSFWISLGIYISQKRLLVKSIVHKLDFVGLTGQLLNRSVISLNLDYWERYTNRYVFLTFDFCRWWIIWGAESVIIALKNPANISYLFMSRVVCRQKRFIKRKLSAHEDQCKTAWRLPPRSSICNLVNSVAGRARRSHLIIWQQTEHSSKLHLINLLQQEQQ
jgi:hypothetical protein